MEEIDPDLQASSALPAEIAGIPSNLFLGVVAMLGAKVSKDEPTKQALNQLGNGQIMNYLHALGLGPR